MPLQCGLLNRDGRAATGRQIREHLGDYFDARKEISGEAIAATVAMAYRGDRITQEDGNDVQPLTWGGYTVTFDGRIDNRDEWLQYFPSAARCTVPDSALVARGYKELGAAVFSALIGEFAIVLFDQPCGNLFLVRSTCGARPLYYVADSKKVSWSSDFAHLVKTSQADLGINEDYIFEYLAGHPRPTHTPLKKIQVVPPDTLLRFSRQGAVTAKALWNVDRIKPIVYPKDADYEEHCRRLVTEAVRCRLRTKRPVFSELSGGFDSSTVVLTADEVLQQETGESKLETVSCVYGESATCDERQFIHEVEKTRGVDSTYVSENDLRVTLGLRDVRFTGLPNPLHCYPGRFAAYRAVMRNRGARVLLTGTGGDHLFWNLPPGPAFVADEMWRGNFRAMHRECLKWSHLLAAPYLHLLLGQAIPLALSQKFFRSIRLLRASIPRWIPERQQKRLEARLQDGALSRRSGLPPSAYMHCELIASLFAHIAAGHHQEYHDIYVSHPYTYRPLVEFCLAVPLSQQARDGTSRSLMRRSFQNLLPPGLLARRSKGTIDETFFRAIRREWDTVGDLRQWELCQRGLANKNELLQDLEQARAGYHPALAGLIRVFSAERWLRSLSLANQQPLEHMEEFAPAI